MTSAGAMGLFSKFPFQENSPVGVHLEDKTL